MVLSERQLIEFLKFLLTGNRKRNKRDDYTLLNAKYRENHMSQPTVGRTFLKFERRLYSQGLATSYSPYVLYKDQKLDIAIYAGR